MDKKKVGRPSKGLRTCVCGYTTADRSNFSKHRKTCTKASTVDKDARISSLEQQLVQKESAVSDTNEHHWKEKVSRLSEELKAKDEQLRAKDEQLLNLTNQLLEQIASKDEQILNLTNQLLQQANKKLDAHKAQKTAKRKKLSEPERRQIAMRQDWNCANPDGKCCLRDKLQEYDIDHIIPLCQGGQDDPSNFQAICPACHRRKTERDLLAAVEPTEVD